MKRRRFRSFAKINLGLEVVGRLGNGYHELKTLFASVSLHDVIEIAEAGTGVTVRSTHPEVPTDPTNLAGRAAVIMQGLAKRKTGLTITIHKRIAVGGGLGGGSSNAATVLRALDLMWNLGLGPKGLMHSARSLGADVPYFLFGGPALGLGRGDDIHPLDLKLRERVLLVQGAGGVATAAVFRRFAALGGPSKGASRIDAFLRPVGIGSSGPGRALKTLRNDLEPAALALSPNIATTARMVRQVGRATSATQSAMSGSGSSFFLLFGDPKAERAAAASLRASGFEIVTCRFLSRRSYRDRFEIEGSARRPGSPRGPNFGF
ncbi:MAG: 4-(cytidine 5'-diphospho)-2-C-methyl-D-erythritol kinase [Vicinamibacteria bacterium]|nr:4-(cytidine 5'-diphospho)-2-C-methyl-D-erythritol kinase [Vicinamibacteria bacterium]